MHVRSDYSTFIWSLFSPHVAAFCLQYEHIEYVFLVTQVCQPKRCPLKQIEAKAFLNDWLWFSGIQIMCLLPTKKQMNTVFFNHWLHVKLDVELFPKSGSKASQSPPSGWLQYRSENPSFLKITHQINLSEVLYFL